MPSFRRWAWPRHSDLTKTMFSAEQSGEGEARPTALQRTVKGSEPRGGAARSAQREDTALGGDDAAGGACLLTFRCRDVGRIKQMKDVSAGVSGRSPSIPCAVT